MESKIIKVITTGDISRDARVITGIEVDGSAYVIYYIDRDGEQDNIFSSKLANEVDGTVRLLDFEDSNEKEMISKIVKEMIMKSVTDSENDKVNGNNIILSDGKKVNFCPVLVNLEQNIDVNKTYITTVKKNVTVVSEKYFDIEFPKAENVEAKVNEPLPVSPVDSIFPETTNEPSAILPEVPVVEPTPAVVAPATPEVVSQPQDILPIPNTDPLPVSAPVLETPVAETNVVLPEPVVPVVATPVQASVIESVPSVAEPVVPEVPAENAPLVFDGSKESNLNKALGEVSKEAIPVSDIDVVKEFGVDEPVSSTIENVASEQPVQNETNTDAKVLVKKAGFANSKFFMVIAVAFFFASCVFLGYEAFQYFQMVK